jgi:hypothetical protein
MWKIPPLGDDLGFQCRVCGLGDAGEGASSIRVPDRVQTGY